MSTINLFGSKSKTQKYIILFDNADNIKRDILPDFENLGDAIEFSKDYINNDDELLYIDLSNHPDIVVKYQNTCSSSSSVNSIDKDYELNNLKDIFVGIEKNGQYDLKIQKIYNRFKMYKPFISFINDSCKITPTKKMVFLDKKTDIFYDSGSSKIYFNSFKVASSILDLSCFYREANEDDFNRFKTHNKLECVDTLKQNKTTLKQIAQIIDENLLENYSLKDLKKYAKTYNLNLTIDKNKIHINNNDDVKKLFDLLKENYFSSEISNTKYRTNSKRNIDG